MAFSQHGHGKRTAHKAPRIGRFSQPNTSAYASSATANMMVKLETLFTLKRRFSLADAWEQLTPLKLAAKIPELRSSLEKVMPEKLASSMQHSIASGADFSTAGSETSEREISHVNSSESLDQSMLRVAADARAAKSVIRLSNAIMPLLSHYTASVSASSSTAPEIKPSASPKKVGKSKPTAKALSGRSSGSASAVVNVQEVHHAFHSVLKHIQRLETAAAAAASSASTAALYGAKLESAEASPSLPPLVDVMMNENNEKVYAHIASLEKQLHNVQDSKRRQYESLQEQLHASERQNAALRSKLQAAQQQREAAAQAALEKEKQLQAAMVHLGAAQEEVKHLKAQTARIPKQKREHTHEIHEAALLRSRYSAAQFIKMTAQIDSLREELQRERKESHKKIAALEEAAERAESRAAYSSSVAGQLMQQIAHSDYFQQHPDQQPPAGGAVAMTPEETGGADEGADLVDDSHLYVDAPDQQPSPVGSDGSAQSSTISTVSSGHGSGNSAGTGNAFLSSEPEHVAGAAKLSATLSQQDAAMPLPAVSATPPRLKRAGGLRNDPANKSVSVTAVATAEKASVLTSPTRSSYQRTLATVEQFFPGAAPTNANDSMRVAGHNNTTLSTLPSAASQHVKEPWRPSSPTPVPAHIRAGYYVQQGSGGSGKKHAVNHKNRSVASSHSLQEGGFKFNESVLSRGRSRGGTPVRSIRPRKSDTLMQDTESASLSPFRRSAPADIMRSSYAAHQSQANQHTHHSQSPPKRAVVHRELSEAKCSYCARNLLELWTRKFGAQHSVSTATTATNTETDCAVEDEFARLTHRRGEKGEKEQAEDYCSESDSCSDEADGLAPLPMGGTGAAAAVPHKSSTAVMDSSGHSVSYALGWNTEDREVPPPPPPSVATAAQRGPIPPAINTNARVRSQSTSPHMSVHFARPQHGADAEDMSAITDTSELVRQRSASESMVQSVASAQFEHRYRSSSPVTKSGGGIAAAGVSPLLPSASASLSRSRSGDEHSRSHSPHRSQSPHRGDGSSHSQSSRRHHHVDHTVEAERAGAVEDHHFQQSHEQAAAFPGQRQMGVDSSNETLESFPVMPANTATSQHTAQLLQKLRARNIQPKAFLTGSDTRHSTAAALTSQCNELIREYNEVLMTLGNELLVADSMKLDYKQEIHESVSLISELQKKVSTLQTENASLYDTVTAARAERDALDRRQDELVHSIREELLQAREENEDLQEEAESLKNQLFDSVSHSFGPGAAPASPSRRAISRSVSYDTEHERTQHLQDQKRIADLERVVERQAADGADLKERFEQSRMQVFAAEMALADCRQELAAQTEATQSLQHQLNRQQAHLTEHADRRAAAHTAWAEDALTDAQQKVADCEALQRVQAQLLEQRDQQIQQLTESQHVQLQLNQTLQHQLNDLRSKFAGVGQGTNEREDEVDRLRQQLESTFQQLEEAKRHHTAQQQAAQSAPALLPPPISLRSASYDTHARLPTPVSHCSKPPTPSRPTATNLSVAMPQHADDSPARSPYGASSASSVRSNLTAASATASAASSPHYQLQQSAYIGDLQYISSLGPIPEESSVRSSTTQPSVAPTAGVQSASADHHQQQLHQQQDVHSYSESKQSESYHYSHSTAAQGSVPRAAGVPASAAQDAASVQSDYSAGADATPVHTLLRGAYAEEQSERAMDETIHKQLQSLTATNAALSARATQLEQRLRHSELRCKLLMDQIKSMPVSLTVAQAEKRVTECKLEKATTTYEINIKKLTESTNKKIHELTAYLHMERADRAKCETQLREHKETVHQLTHHVRVLRTQLQLQQDQQQLLDPLGDSFRPEGTFPEFSFPAASGAFGQSHSSSVPQISQRYGSTVGEAAHGDTLFSAQSLMAAANTHSTAAVAQLSRTVPLTPQSARVMGPEHGSLHHTLPSRFDASQGLQQHLQQQHQQQVFSHSARSGVSVRDPRAVPSGSAWAQESYVNNVNIIRASIPPAPWEQA